MSGNYFTVYPQRQIVSIHWSGAPVLRDWYDVVERILAHRDYRPGMSLMTYRGNSHGGMTPELVREILEVFERLAGRTMPLSVAIIAPSPCHFGMARMAEAMSDSATVVVRAFKRPREALQWLKAPIRYEHGGAAAPRELALAP